MHVDGDARLQVLTVVLADRRPGRDDDHLLQHISLLLVRLPHRILALLRHRQRGLHVVCPHELDTQEGDLRGVAEDELLELLGLHLVVCLADDALDRVLHAVDERLEPRLDVSGGDHRLLLQVAVAALAGDEGLERNLLVLLREHLEHLVLVLLVELDRGDRVEETGLEVRADGRGIRPERQNLQQSRVRDEIEAREHRPLGVQKGGESLLAQLELLGEHR